MYRRGWSIHLRGNRVGLSVCCLVFFIIVFSTNIFAAELELTAKAAILVDARSGKILFEKNIDEPLPIASVTKLMTLVIILEAVDQGKIALTDMVTTSKHAASMGGSQVWLEVGEQLPLKEMLYAIAVGSANDASVAVAEYFAGSEAAFTELMNQKARELGLTNTEYSNASGLPPSVVGSGGRQVMSARDVATLARYASQVPLLMDFVSTYEYTMRADSTQRPQLWNYNKLLRRYQGVDGFKTGYTTEAGYCLAATAVRNGLRLIAVVLGSTSEANRESDITKLLDYGFREYMDHLVYTQGAVVGEISIPKGDPQLVNAVVSSDLHVTVKRGEQDQIITEIILKQDYKLPLSVDEPIGTISAYLNGELLASAPLVPQEAVNKASIIQLMTRITKRMIKILCEGS